MVFFHSEHLYRRTLKYESRSIDAENEKEIRYIGANLNITYLKNSGILSPSNLYPSNRERSTSKYDIDGIVIDEKIHAIEKTQKHAIACFCVTDEKKLHFTTAYLFTMILLSTTFCTQRKGQVWL